VRYRFDDCELDTDRHELRRGGAAQPLEPLAFDLLRHLIENRERVVSKDDLRATVWSGRVVSESTLSSWMTTVRAAIGDDGEAQRLIRTVPRRGFRFVGTISEGAAPESETPVSPGPAVQPAAADPAAPRALARTGRTQLAVLVAGAGLAVAAIAVVLGVFAGRSSAPPARKFEASAVPLVDDDTRRALATYPARPGNKAVALATNLLAIGVADGAPDVETAKNEALRQCGASGRAVCRIYATNMEVVWSAESLPFPAARDLRTELLDTPLRSADLPTLSEVTRRVIDERFLTVANHKAIAMTTGGVNMQTGRQTRDEAIRMTVERCSVIHQRPCMLVSLDGFLTVRIPQTRTVARIFLPSTEPEIPAAERERIAQIYQGRDWRALAHGANGSWHPVANAPSEAAAIEGALKLCAQSHAECRLYAIGNFRVGD
jgi:DNA-binding winged helix-turn-helix (wHTH) protein